MSETRLCTGECNVHLDISQFEGNRKICKICRNKKRKEQKANKTPLTQDMINALPKPHTICTLCELPIGNDDFVYRADTQSWRNQCNTCIKRRQHDEQYYKKYRENKTATPESAAAYRQHNREVLRNWKERNPENVTQHHATRRANITDRYNSIVSTAAKRNIAVIAEDEVLLYEKLAASCFYCDRTAGVDELTNGLDRVDSKGPYSDNNTVCCCVCCNMMKGAYTITTFVQNVRKIHDHTVSYLTLSTSVGVRGSGLRQGLAPGAKGELTQSIKKIDELNESRKIQLWCSPCYLCGKVPAMGLDRYDSSIGYTDENTRSCCTDCNYMKKNMSFDDFVLHIRNIYTFTKYWCVPYDEKKYTFLGTEHNPVFLKNVCGFFEMYSKGRVAYIFKASIHTLTTKHAIEISSSCHEDTKRMTEDDIITVLSNVRGLPPVSKQ